MKNKKLKFVGKLMGGCVGELEKTDQLRLSFCFWDIFYPKKQKNVF
jgi:hypothetical protein